MPDHEPIQRKNEQAPLPWDTLLSGDELLQMAIRDPLTGLLNRRAFDEGLRWIWHLGRE